MAILAQDRQENNINKFAIAPPGSTGQNKWLYVWVQRILCLSGGLSRRPTGHITKRQARIDLPVGWSEPLSDLARRVYMSQLWKCEPRSIKKGDWARQRGCELICARCIKRYILRLISPGGLGRGKVGNSQNTARVISRMQQDTHVGSGTQITCFPTKNVKHKEENDF